MIIICASIVVTNIVFYYQIQNIWIILMREINEVQFQSPSRS